MRLICYTKMHMCQSRSKLLVRQCRRPRFWLTPLRRLWGNKDMGVIYCITNEITGKYYIGQTIQNPRKRFNDHMTMQPEKSGARSLASSIRKHGRENFTMDILAKCLDRDELDRLEALWILI